ncbi:MAG: creatininase family protein [Pseudomonadota bacterium]
MTFRQAQAAFAQCPAVLLPVGSTEQHGPMGLIGTDAICAEAVAERAAELAGAVMLPVVAYTPAAFNMAFCGTVSVSPALFRDTVAAVVAAMAAHGVRGVYVVNGHGANLAPLAEVAGAASATVRVRSWWDFEAVSAIRKARYGAWEGMHATPSEVAMTMAVHGPLPVPPDARTPPERLSEGFVEAHAGDRHGPPDEHRARFPDGRVGSHSALATEADGAALLEAAADAVAADFSAFADALDEVRR